MNKGELIDAVEARGEQRFRLRATDAQPDGLQVADIEFLEREPTHGLPPDFAYLGEILREVLPQVSGRYEVTDALLEDAAWVSARCAEVLPLAAAQKQALLETDDVTQRLRSLDSALQALRREV